MTARNYTRRTHEPFAIQLAAGNKIYVITSPEDVCDTFDNTSGLDYSHHLSDLLRTFGIGEEDLQKSWRVPRPGDRGYVAKNPHNPRQLPFIKWVQALYRDQLMSGARMDTMCSSFIRSCLKNLQWSQLDDCTMGFLEERRWLSEPRRVVSLYQLVRSVMIEAAIQSMFGDHLSKLDSNIVEHVITFNDYAWMTVFNYPDIFRRYPIHAAQSTLKATFKRFAALPESERTGACWLINTTIKGMETTGLSMDARSSMLLMMFWA